MNENALRVKKPQISETANESSRVGFPPAYPSWQWKRYKQKTASGKYHQRTSFTIFIDNYRKISSGLPMEKKQRLLYAYKNDHFRKRHKAGHAHTSDHGNKKVPKRTRDHLNLLKRIHLEPKLPRKDGRPHSTATGVKMADPEEFRPRTAQLRSHRRRLDGKHDKKPSDESFDQEYEEDDDWFDHVNETLRQQYLGNHSKNEPFHKIDADWDVASDVRSWNRALYGVYSIGALKTFYGIQKHQVLHTILNMDAEELDFLHESKCKLYDRVLKKRVLHRSWLKTTQKKKTIKKLKMDDLERLATPYSSSFSNFSYRIHTPEHQDSFTEAFNDYVKESRESKRNIKPPLSPKPSLKRSVSRAKKSVMGTIRFIGWLEGTGIVELEFVIPEDGQDVTGTVKIGSETFSISGKYYALRDSLLMENKDVGILLKGTLGDADDGMLELMGKLGETKLCEVPNDFGDSKKEMTFTEKGWIRRIDLKEDFAKIDSTVTIGYRHTDCNAMSTQGVVRQEDDKSYVELDGKGIFVEANTTIIIWLLRDDGLPCLPEKFLITLTSEKELKLLAKKSFRIKKPGSEYEDELDQAPKRPVKKKRRIRTPVPTWPSKKYLIERNWNPLIRTRLYNNEDKEFSEVPVIPTRKEIEKLLFKDGFSFEDMDPKTSVKLPKSLSMPVLIENSRSKEIGLALSVHEYFNSRLSMLREMRPKIPGRITKEMFLKLDQVYKEWDVDKVWDLFFLTPRPHRVGYTKKRY